jgi:hypothetical protein
VQGLIGLYYCIFWQQVTAQNLEEAHSSVKMLPCFQNHARQSNMKEVRSGRQYVCAIDENG